ncbi:endonuclease/exonuclease/phosphatase family protein [Sinomicrobium kalidii]|uniref:endonuclease/exonuclease/phosphatase family protein n=1 Tax=Sinomicrobium kalidii TaxID=2900738 RepID=UPI001E373225|nr:endonuclease/exonuclease/phosphatase family protein [Sinomicrobium kalidii]UGU15081.1 endonuclease/exonuclease/phosphatase family protein [Sinomicrobium kalidii]
MKKTIVLLCSLFLLQATRGNPVVQRDSTLTVFSYNIRYANPGDGINTWEHRREWLAESISFFEGDIVGAQEVLHSQLKDLLSLLPEYAYVGVARDDGRTKGEFSPILYRKDRFELLQNETFWLSDTPEKVGSVGWDAALPRIVTWAKFRDRNTGKIFFFFNTHFDHKGEQARRESAKLIASKVKKIAGNLPAFITGDFNSTPDSEAYGVMDADEDIFNTSEKAEKSYGPDFTFNGWKINPDPEKHHVIDYIFFKGNIKIYKHHVLDIQRGERFASDHYPVIVKAKL